MRFGVRWGVVASITLGFVALTACSQTDVSSKTTDENRPWFGLTPPGNTPEVFAPDGFNPDYNDFNPVFTPDGNEFYFTSDIDGNYTIKVMRRTPEGWTAPEIAEFSGTYQDCDMVLLASRFRAILAVGRGSV